MTDDGDCGGDGFGDIGDGHSGGLWYDAIGSGHVAPPGVAASYARSAPFEPGASASMSDPWVLPDHLWADPFSSPECLDGAGPTASTSRGVSTHRIDPVHPPQPSWWSRPPRWFAFWR